MNLVTKEDLLWATKRLESESNLYRDLILNAEKGRETGNISDEDAAYSIEVFTKDVKVIEERLERFETLLDFLYNRQPEIYRD